MQPTSKTNPNALCSCDSGKKYKHCCGAVDAAPKKNWYGLLIPLVAIVATVGFLLHSTVKSDNSAPTGLGSGLGLTGTRGGGASGTTTAPAPITLTPPPDEIPEGKYWHPAHGHFHDIQPVDAGAGTSSVTLPVI